MLHLFAALFLPNILRITPSVVGVVLLNPAWEVVPGSDVENMTHERAQVGVPALIVGSENDQILVREHFEEWRRALPQTDAEWCEKTGHFLMRADEIPDQNEYIAREGHVNEKVMCKVVTWIRSHWSE